MRCAGYENVELHLGDLNNGYPIINCNHRWRFTITPDFSDRRHSNSDRAAPAQLYRGNLPHYYWPGRRVSPVTALFASNPLWGILVGSGTGMIAMVLGATVAERWFVRNRGLVLGILTASNTTGQLIFLPLLANLVVNFGWRAVSLIVALITLLIAPIAAFVLRNRPADFSSGLLCILAAFLAVFIRSGSKRILLAESMLEST